MKNIFSKKITYVILAALSVFFVSLKVIAISHSKKNSNTSSNVLVNKNVPPVASATYSTMLGSAPTKPNELGIQFSELDVNEMGKNVDKSADFLFDKPPTADGKFVNIAFTAENVSDHPLQFQANGFVIKDEQGNIYHPIEVYNSVVVASSEAVLDKDGVALNQNPIEGQAQLSPQVPCTWNLLADVPTDAKNLTLDLMMNGIVGYPPKKCPQDYPNTDEGDRERRAAMNNWTNEYFDTHNDATITDWSNARMDFYKEYNCTEALKNIADIKNGTASPALVDKEKAVNAAVDNWVANNADPGTDFVNMPQSDTDRIKEIVSAVSEDTDPASKSTQQEVADLFAKYKMTDDEISMFRTYGPGFIFANYDLLFFNDALESLKEGKPVKSEARKGLEDAGLAYNTVTKNFITAEDQVIENISKKEPAMGTTEAMTEDDILGFLNYARTRASRVDALFDK